MKMLLLLALAGCAGGKRDATSAHAAADRTNSDSERALAVRLDEERVRLGAARFEPVFEPVGDPARAGDPASPATAPPAVRTIVDPSGLRFRVEDGRVGYTTYTGSACGAWGPPMVPLFARTPTGVRIVVVTAKVERVTEHISGSCGMPGCGTQPPPPVEQVAWLGVADPAAITVDVVLVPYRRREVTCDHPLYPP